MYYSETIQFKQVIGIGDLVDILNKINRTLSRLIKLLFIPIILPFAILIVVIVHWRIKKLNRKLKVIVTELGEYKHDFSVYSYKDISFVYDIISLFFDRYGETNQTIKERNPKALRLVAKEYLLLVSNLDIIKDKFQEKLYVNASHIEMSKDDKTYLKELFGPDEGYREDTYIQLSK